MRLTLRTLLAYMNNILEPADAEAIGKKIEETPQAAGLLRRARDVMRRLRLKAPEVDERGSGLDPNTVAEYLDNVLPDDRVPDFERVCLDSDMHLAEVASCHQILSLVLGEPAEVDPASREHMYQLPQVMREQAAMEAEAAAAEAAAGAQPPASPPPPRRPKPVVPDYLRESSRRKGRGGRRLAVTAAMLVLIACGVVVVLALSGQLDRLGLRLPGTVAQGEGDPLAPAGAPPEESPDLPEPGQLGPENPAAPLGETPAGPGDQPPADPGAVQPPVTEPPAALPTANEPPGNEPPVAVPPAALPPVEQPSNPPAVEQPGVEQPPAALPGVEQPGAQQSGPAGPSNPEPPAAVPGVATPETPGTLPGNAPANPLPGSPPAEPPAAAPAVPQGLGRFVSDNQVLLQFDRASNAWTRVPAQAILTPQQELLSLPAFRPLVALNSGLAFHMLDGTRVALEPAGAEGVPGVHVAAGRIVARTLGGAENRLLLIAGDHRGVITLSDPESTLAVDVGRPLTDGVDPEKQPAAKKVDLYVSGGRILWTQAGAEPVEVRAPARLTLALEKPELVAGSEHFPDWLLTDTTSRLDRWASDTVEQETRSGRPIALALTELVGHRKREVSWLAIRCLASLDEFAPLVRALGDADRKLDWPEYVEQFRLALTRGPEAAAAVRTALQNADAAGGEDTARMLWGYTDAQLLDEGAATALVNSLQHGSLTVRRLGIWNLRRITGVSLSYQPEFPPEKSQPALRNWKKRLDPNEIRHAPAPATPATPPVRPAAGGARSG